MDYHLMLPDEAATLVGSTPAKIVELIETGKLGAFRDQDRWWIPLQCLTLFAGDELPVEAACALSEVFKKEASFLRTFGAHPEAVQRIEGSDFPPGSVGACLKQALLMSRRSQAMPLADLNRGAPPPLDPSR